ncbi:ubiquitin thioesterase OTUB1 [Biomphalaria pfeifferi]|uniref:ubiquitinyl hydrolase 1 n=1 Tax=Biomphalaria pfeifferi TaxID=112525 RepID=A0AAD8FBD2_BIOPF|nr:ubiquitin thioesterase OTUB1 [Biomphalaria pfeifferi]
MASEQHAFAYDPEKNYDEDIMAQQRQIEKEIAETQPLVSGLFTFDDIVEEYTSEDAVYRHKIEDLKTRYANMRKTRGDGNCFFRAFGFAFLESLIKDPTDYSRFLELVTKSKDELIALGFPQFTLEDFYDTFIDIVKQVKSPGTVEKLVETFNDQGLSDYFVVYLRQKKEDEYIHFIDGERTVKQFCSQEVEPMGKESDHIHIVALTKALEVPIRVEYMDREGLTCNAFTFSASDTSDDLLVKPAVSLLYRPGHYDILYPL